MAKPRVRIAVRQDGATKIEMLHAFDGSRLSVMGRGEEDWRSAIAWANAPKPALGFVKHG